MKLRTFVAPLLVVVAVASFGMWLQGAVPDVPTGTWLPGPALSQPRTGATSVTLPDGGVLVIGGRTADGPVRTVETYGADGVLRAGHSLSIPRAGHTAVALPDGSVLVIGGTTLVAADDGGTREAPTATAELYVGGTWMSVGLLSFARTGHTATALADGRVLVAGGTGETGALDSLEIYDPQQGTFSFLTVLPAPVTEHAAALAGDSQVLIVGGRSGGVVQASASLVDVDTASVVPVTLGAPRAAATATRLLTGKVLIAGGYTVEQTPEGAAVERDLASSEIVNVKVSPVTVSAGPSMAQARRAPEALLLPNNNTVLVTGGTSNGAVVTTAEQFVPWASSFAATGSPASARTSATLAGLKTDGVALLAGGAAAQTELYGFATIRTDKDDYSPGMTVYVSGAGWQPGETVTFKLREVAASDGTSSTSCTLRTFSLVADDTGRITNAKLFDVEEHHLGVRFYLTATGAASQAQVTFTDGQAWTLTISPNQANASQTQTYTLTATNTSDGGNSFSCLEVAVPPEFSSVTGVAVVQVSSGKSWTRLSSATSSNIQLAAQGNANRLGSGESIQFAVTATAPANATGSPFAWIGDAIVAANCSGSSFPPPTGGQPAVAVTANTAPTATSQSVTTLEDQATNVTLGSSDANGDAQTFSIVTSPAHGTLSSIGPVTCSGTSPKTCTAAITYTPAPNYNGSDSFTFKSNDGTTDSAVATVSVTVDPVNDAPAFTKGANQTVLEDAGPQTVPNWATGIGPGGGSDEAGQTLTFNVTGNTNTGLFAAGPAIAANGTLSYTPAANQAGTATITVQLTDSGGTGNGGSNTSATESFDITVTAVNDAPVFTKGADQTVLEDAGAQSVSNWATGIGPGGGSDETGQALTFVVANNTNPALFSVVPAVSATGTLTYTTAPNQNGTATITLRLDDNGGTANGGVASSSTQTFTITVTPVNDAPVFTKGADQTIAEDAGAQIVANWATAIGSGGGADEAGQTVAFSVTGNTNPALFSVAPAVSPTGELTYAPAANQSGTATISLALADNGGTANGGVDTSPTQTFVITVTAVNDAPVFTKGADQTVAEDAGAQTVTNWATGISPGGGADEAGQTLTFVVTNNTNSALFAVPPTVSSAGTLTYTTAPNQFGTATITITLEDDGGTVGGGIDTSAPETFVITVTPVNDAPVAVTDGYSTNEDIALSPPTPGVLGNDSDVENDTLVATLVSGPAHAASFVLNADGSFTYGPAQDYNGPDSFSYRACDNGTTAGSADPLCSATTTVTITVVPVNDAPASVMVVPSSATIAENGSATVSGSFTDPDIGDAHTVIINWNDGSPTASISLSAGVFSFGPISHQYKDDNPTNTPFDTYAVVVTVVDNGAPPESGAGGGLVTVNNVAPSIGGLIGPTAPLAVNSAATITANFTDVGTMDTHTCTFDWDDSTSDTGVAATETNGSGSCERTHPFVMPGVYGVKVTVTDDDTGQATSTYEFVVVYDPSAGFVTGGGWINSPEDACRLDSCTTQTTGRANFGFVSKYKKGSNVPEGQTEFQFQAGKLNFHSSSYDAGTLVVSGYKAQYRGTGDINGVPGYKFVVTAYDGQVNGGGGVDKFRIKITSGIGLVVYDNKMSASDDIDAADPMAIAGGSIVIHK